MTSADYGTPVKIQAELEWENKLCCERKCCPLPTSRLVVVAVDDAHHTRRRSHLPQGG